MSGLKKYSCVVVGEGNLTLCCIKKINESSLRLLAVVTSHQRTLDWCCENSIPHIHSDIKYEKELREFCFDYLLCVINEKKLSSEIINQATILSLNYHDSLLPKYAGVHATAWAILCGESRQGITWHVMNDKIDDGAIILAKSFKTTSMDSSFSINLKCFEMAVCSLPELISLLNHPPLNVTPQNKLSNSFYYKSDKPKSNGIITQGTTLLDCQRLLSAANFGFIHNDFFSVKISIGRKYYYILKAKVEFFKHNDSPGRIKSVSTGSICMALNGGYLLITKIADEKEVLSICSLVNIHALGENSQLSLAHSFSLAEYIKIVKNNHFNEKFLINSMSDYKLAYIGSWDNDCQPDPDAVSNVFTMNSEADEYMFFANIVEIIAGLMGERKIVFPVQIASKIAKTKYSNLFLNYSFVYIDLSLLKDITSIKNSIQVQLLNQPLIQSDILWRYKKINHSLLSVPLLISLNDVVCCKHEVIFNCIDKCLRVFAPNCAKNNEAFKNIICQLQSNVSFEPPNKQRSVANSNKT